MTFEAIEGGVRARGAGVMAVRQRGVVAALRHGLVVLLMGLVAACSESSSGPEANSADADSSPASEAVSASSMSEPMAADEGGAVLTEEAIIAAHRAALVLDAHADVEIPGSPSRYALPDGTSQVDPSLMRQGGVDAVVLSIAVGPGPRDAEGYAAARATAEAELQAVQGLARDPANNAVIPRTPAELVQAHADGQLAFVLGLQNALILGTDPTAVDEFFAEGVRVFALTHMGHNDYADSSRPLFIAETGEHEPAAEHGGLSALGIAAVARVNALGGIVDISQLSREAALDVMARSTAPVIASHSNVQALSNVSRNLSDEELDRLKEIGGVVHVAPFRGYLFDSSDEALDAAIRAARREAGVKEDYLYPFELYWEIDDPEAQAAFLGSVSSLLGPGRLEDMLDHIDYVAQRIGVEHVGIGTDFNHGSGVEGFSHAGDALNVTRGLMERGYSAEEVAAIWGGNFLRVWAAAEQQATIAATGTSRR